MRKKIKYFISFYIAVFIISSCQKVITIDLNSTNIKLAIEGNVSDQAGTYSVQLSQTVNYDQYNVFPAVTGATVNISDNVGNSETLIETTPGMYVTSSLVGTVGRTYNVSVTSGGKNYITSSLMANPVAIDTIIVDSTGVFGTGGQQSTTNKKVRTVRVKFKDPAGINNYYRLIETVNGKAKTNIYITSDNLRDGIQISTTLSRDTTVHKGDSVGVMLLCIDKYVYTYFRTLNQISGGGTGLQTSTPDNPTTNFSNSPLGYFSANAIKSKKVKVL